MSLRSPLGKVKGLGSAHSGTDHHIKQRASAVVMAFLLVWFTVTLVRFVLALEIDRVYMLANPLQLILFFMFAIVALYHGALGMQMVIEDYVQCKYLRLGTILLVKVIALASVLAGCLAALILHFTSFSY